ncbi:hypothetical protein ACFQ2Y_19490 [Streptomyces malaysiensis subsp. malaysiensis]
MRTFAFATRRPSPSRDAAARRFHFRTCRSRYRCFCVSSYVPRDGCRSGIRDTLGR